MCLHDFTTFRGKVSPMLVLVLVPVNSKKRRLATLLASTSLLRHTYGIFFGTPLVKTLRKVRNKASNWCCCGWYCSCRRVYVLLTSFLRVWPLSVCGPIAFSNNSGGCGASLQPVPGGLLPCRLFQRAGCTVQGLRKQADRHVGCPRRCCQPVENVPGLGAKHRVGSVVTSAAFSLFCLGLDRRLAHLVRARWPMPRVCVCVCVCVRYIAAATAPIDSCGVCTPKGTTTLCQHCAARGLACT